MTPFPYKLIGELLLVLALVAAVLGYGHYQYNKGVTYTTMVYEAAIQKSKLAAAGEMRAETDKVRATEHALQALKDKQEITDAEHEKTVAGLAGKLRISAGAAGRLRDPNAAGCGGGSGGSQSSATGVANAGANNAAEASGLLSTELTGLLQRLTGEADTISAAYTSCRADSQAIRAQP